MKEKDNKVMILIKLLFALCILVPVLSVVIWSLIERFPWPEFLPVVSLRAIREIFARKEKIILLFVSSILISFVVATLSVVIATMTARAFVCYEFHGKSILYYLSILPLMVPATVFAMGIQVTFIKLNLNNSVLGVVIAHLIYSLPYAIQLLMDGTKGIGKGLEEQARVLGATAWRAFYKISLPLLIPVMLTAFSMAYIVSFSQYFLTLLIGGGKVKTFTIVMVPYLQGGERNIASVYSTVFLIITVLVFGVFEWIARKISKNHSVDYYA